MNTKDYDKEPFSVLEIRDSEGVEPIKEVKQIKFSCNGNYILCGTSEGVLMVLDAYEGTMLRKFFVDNGSEMSLECSFSPCSRYVIAGSETKKIHVFNVETGTETKLIEFHPKSVNCVRFSHQHLIIFSGCQNLVFWIPESIS